MHKRIHLPAPALMPWPMFDQPGDGIFPACTVTLLRCVTSNPACFSGVFFHPLFAGGAA